MKRKVLVSPGYGAGWVSWADGSIEFKRWLLTYQPIIDFLEAGGQFTNADCESYPSDKKMHPLLEQLKKEAEEKFDKSYIYLGGANDLVVKEVVGPIKIEEYDGYESIAYPGEGEWL